MSELPPSNSEDLLKQLTQTSSDALSQVFADQQGLMETDREISKNDKQDSYAIRQRRKHILLQILDYLPCLAWFALWFVVIWAACILGAYFYHICGDERKLAEVIWNIIYAGLLSSAALFWQGIFHDRK